MIVLLYDLQVMNFAKDNNSIYNIFQIIFNTRFKNSKFKMFFECFQFLELQKLFYIFFKGLLISTFAHHFTCNWNTWKYYLKNSGIEGRIMFCIIHFKNLLHLPTGYSNNQQKIAY